MWVASGCGEHGGGRAYEAALLIKKDRGQGDRKTRIKRKENLMKSKVKPKRVLWEEAKALAKASNAWELPVFGIRCWRCSDLIIGAIFIDKKDLTVTDSIGFMVFSNEIVCDNCLAEVERALFMLHPAKEEGDNSKNPH